MAGKDEQNTEAGSETEQAVTDTAAVAEAPLVLEEKDDLTQRIERAIEAWTSAHLHNSPFSRVTEAWNHFRAGIPVLIEKIKQEMEG